jgi:hypothetical protein
MDDHGWMNGTLEYIFDSLITVITVVTVVTVVRPASLSQDCKLDIACAALALIAIVSARRWG